MSILSEGEEGEEEEEELVVVVEGDSIDLARPRWMEGGAVDGISESQTLFPPL